MDSDMVKALNDVLYDQNLSDEEKGQFIQQILKREKCDVKIADMINDYTEEKLAFALKEKTEGVKAMNFDWAVEWRDKHQEIERVLEIKSTFKIDKSQFVFHSEELIFFSFGNTDWIERLIDITEDTKGA